MEHKLVFQIWLYLLFQHVRKAILDHDAHALKKITNSYHRFKHNNNMVNIN